MNQSEVEEFVEQMENVEREENFGYIFFFVGDDHRLPFVTIGESDNEFDTVSNLNREGIYRINIGVSKKTFESIVPDATTDNIDFSVLDVFLPHPHYAKQHFLCILNPIHDNVAITKDLMIEAHTIATARMKRKIAK